MQQLSRLRSHAAALTAQPPPRRLAPPLTLTPYDIRWGTKSIGYVRRLLDMVRRLLDGQHRFLEGYVDY